MQRAIDPVGVDREKDVAVDGHMERLDGSRHGGVHLPGDATECARIGQFLIDHEHGKRGVGRWTLQGELDLRIQIGQQRIALAGFGIEMSADDPT